MEIEIIDSKSFCEDKKCFQNNLDDECIDQKTKMEKIESAFLFWSWYFFLYGIIMIYLFKIGVLP